MSCLCAASAAIPAQVVRGPWLSGPKWFDQLFSTCNRQLTDSPGGYCMAGNFRQRKISSKATVRQFVKNLFSSNIGHRSSAALVDRPVAALLLYGLSRMFLIQHLSFCKKKLSQEFNFVKKWLWRKRRSYENFLLYSRPKILERMVFSSSPLISGVFVTFFFLSNWGIRKILSISGWNNEEDTGYYPRSAGQ